MKIIKKYDIMVKIHSYKLNDYDGIKYSIIVLDNIFFYYFTIKQFNYYK